MIATNWDGPADYISADSGYLVNPISRDAMVKAFAQHIDTLAVNPQLRYQVGAAAIARVKQHFMWDHKIETMTHHYVDVIQKHHVS